MPNHTCSTFKTVYVSDGGTWSIVEGINPLCVYFILGSMKYVCAFTFLNTEIAQVA